MLQGIDHVIIGVQDLAQAEQIFTHHLGLTVAAGGVHPTGGTANRIIVLGDSYLELITVQTPAEAQQSILDRLALGPGYLNFALASDAIEADSQAIQERGQTIIGPTAGALRSTDGRSRGWSRTNVGRPDMVQSYPFLIQHDSQGAERRRRLAGWQEPPKHPLGATTILSTTIAVISLDEAAPRFARIYGLEASLPYTGEPDGWDAMLLAFELGQRSQSFELATPLPLDSDLSASESELLPEPGALSRHLRTYGESLCRLTLGVPELAASRRYLDSQNVTYTYREVPQASLWIHPQHACGAAIVLHEHDPRLNPAV